MSNIKMRKVFVYAKKELKDRPHCHGYEHAVHVSQIAEKIMDKFPHVKHEVVLAICLLHDVWDRKFCTKPKTAIAAARAELALAGFSTVEIDNIVDSIENLSWSKGKIPRSYEGMLAQDADRITALGAIGVMRAATYGAHIDRPFDDTITHAKEKCVKLYDSLNLEESQEIAEPLHKFLVLFLQQYDREVAGQV